MLYSCIYIYLYLSLYKKRQEIMFLLQKAKTTKSKCTEKAVKTTSHTKVVLKKITTEELKNTRIASYGYIL